MSARAMPDRVAAPVVAADGVSDALVMSVYSRVEDLARAIAADHHGVVSTTMLRAAGAPKHATHRLFDHPRWEVVTDEVIRSIGSPPTTQQRVVAAVLDAGPASAVSHLSAANRWGRSGCRLFPVHVVRERITQRRPRLAVPHRVRSLPEGLVTELDGVPIVRPELCAMQLFAVCSPERAERLVEAMRSDRLLSGPSLIRFVEEYGARGRNGVGRLRTYVEARGPGYIPPASGVEARFMQLMRDAGLEFRRQVDLGGEHWTGRVDFLHEVDPLVIEVQSERYHSALVDREADRQRLEALRANGFEVLEVTDTLIWSDPAEVIRRVTTALRQSATLHL